AAKGARIGALSAALTSRVPWDRVLRQVSLILPEDVWLTNLAASVPTKSAAGPAAATSSGFTVTGSTYSQNGVARFLSRLSVIPDLANVRLQSSQSTVVSNRELVQFTILADVRSGGAGS
ncbi:MAG TPA: PilN domain-containing protein, partial [Gaiellaceae bacterium]|nr:PilN domain-containing protein [Gaiellaceae bacterium]